MRKQHNLRPPHLAYVDQLDHAVRTAGMVARGEHGRLRIGLHALVPGSFLATLIGRYRERHPGVEVEITEGTARESIVGLRTNRLDVTFVAGSPALPDCHVQRLWSERLLVALPARHRLAEGTGVIWSDLAGDSFIVRQGSTGPQMHDHIVMRLAGTGAGPSIRRFDVGRDTLLTMVAQGYGVTVIGEATTPLHASGLTFLPILDEPEPLPCSAIWSPHNRSPALKTLLDLAKEMNR